MVGNEGAPLVEPGFEGTPKGFSHGVIPRKLQISQSTRSLGRRACSCQFLRCELCSPTIEEYNPCEEAIARGTDHVERSAEQANASQLTHGASQDTARVQAMQGTQEEPALRPPQVVTSVIHPRPGLP